MKLGEPVTQWPKMIFLPVFRIWIIYFIIFKSVCVCVFMNAGTIGGHMRPLNSLELGIAGGCEMSNMDTGNLTQVLCKSCAYSQPLIHLSSP